MCLIIKALGNLIEVSGNIDIGTVKEYDMVRFPTIRERTVYRIVEPENTDFFLLFMN